ncbi:MAG: hypothetical protein J7518_06010 [Nocardioidaceae bacterium]|nr:hypothetical protein [Nocardioidaceae bacterium]
MKTRATLLTLALAALTCLPAAGPAQAAGTGPYFVADLSPGRGGISVDTGAVATLGSRLFFNAWTAETGSELFVTDGTTAGTHLVSDALPGTGGSNPQHLLAFGGRIYYSAQDDAGDTELWTSDGTAAGTTRLLDLNAAGSSRPDDLVDLGDRFAFVASADASGDPELWTSKGTAATTVPVTQTDLSSIDAPVRLGSKVVFEGAADVGSEPYVLDPATGKVTLLRDINPGTSGSLPYALHREAVLGGRLYFAAWGGDAQGTELWRTDGTPEGTELVEDIDPGAGSGNPSGFWVAGNALYFGARNDTGGQELWRTDGATTALVRDIAPGAAHSGPQPGTTVGTTMLFSATTEGTGVELWASQGTAASTHQVADINPGQGSGITNSQLFRVGSAVYFSGYDGETHGEELWRSDGTAAGTRMVGDVGAGATWVDLLGATATTVFFTTNDGVHGMELWAYRPPAPVPAPRVATTTRALPASWYSRTKAARKRIVVPVRVGASGRVPQGRVVIKRRGVVWGSATLVSGVVKVRLTRPLRPGRYTGFTATYGGSSTCLHSVSAPFRIVVRR